jgi:hypothetical protein
MSGTICTSNLTSGFIDLATYDELEKYMYGGPDSTAYFVRETRKSTWFTQVPVCLSRCSGQAGFGQEWSVNISRAGDYLCQTWLRLQLNALPLAAAGGLIQWTPNFMHNLIRECNITFNDLVAARFDSFHLDFWAAFTVPASKRVGYNNMIGNFQGGGPLTPATAAATNANQILNLPLPFFFTRDSGVALPTAALPYNDMRINFSFRNWTELLSSYTVAAPNTAGIPATLASLAAGANAPTMTNVQVWANYAIVSNDERKRMACAPRDILIEQVQTAPVTTFNVTAATQQQHDIRFSHAIKALFFASRGTLNANFWSNYTTSFDQMNGAGTAVIVTGNIATAGQPFGDPIDNTSLTYENTQRLANMGSDYYSLVQPFYHAPNIPGSNNGVSPPFAALNTGYHMYSYSIDFYCLDPMGSTNYGKLTNVSLQPVPSALAVASSVVVGAIAAQTYDFVVTAINNNIIRISGGALGFPVL